MLPVAHPAILALGRRHRVGDLVQLYNVSDADAGWPADWLTGFTLGAALQGGSGIRDALTDAPVTADADGMIHVPARTPMWLVADDSPTPSTHPQT